MDENPNYGAVISSGVAWTVVLFPVVLVAILFLTPHILDVLGSVFHFMRTMAEAMK